LGGLSFRKLNIDGLNVFYRESGRDDAPAMLLLHGFPTASHIFPDLIPRLSDRFRVVAPDFPGFGQSDMPSRNGFCCTFAEIADVIDRFVEAAGLDRYAMYIFDYGSPIGFRLAVKHPERVTAIISQNGNVYEEGLSDGWKPIRAYWRQPTQAHRDALRSLLSPETTLWQYTHGVDDPAAVSPDGYSLDDFYMARPGAHEVQLDLLLDYADNVALYPVFQNYLRTYTPRLLAVWGRNDSCQPAPRRSSATFPAVVRFVDTGHFALETHVDEIAVAIREFLTLDSPTQGRRHPAV
jgi:pimeloyl-ACP methyl ester carboxylesterase